MCEHRRLRMRDKIMKPVSNMTTEELLAERAVYEVWRNDTKIALWRRVDPWHAWLKGREHVLTGPIHTNHGKRRNEDRISPPSSWCRVCL